GRVDRRLNLLLGHVDVQLERELKGDQRAPERARRHHLVQPGHLPELPLEGRRHRRRHDRGARARVEREHLDDRIVDLRERGHRQLAIGDDAGEQDRDHQERGRDRAEDEEPGIHAPGVGAGGCSFAGRSGAPAVGSSVCTCTALPARSLSTPFTTTSSPAVTPPSTATSVPSVGPGDSGRTSTVWSGFTAYTNVPCGPRWIAATGTMTVCFFTSTSRRTLTN